MKFFCLSRWWTNLLGIKLARLPLKFFKQQTKYCATDRDLYMMNKENSDYLSSLENFLCFIILTQNLLISSLLQCFLVPQLWEFNLSTMLHPASAVSSHPTQARLMVVNCSQFRHEQFLNEVCLRMNLVQRTLNTLQCFFLCAVSALCCS